MEKATSADGTLIAFDRFGSGPAVIAVSGLLCDRAKMGLVYPFPSRTNPRSRCSVSIEMLPSWLAS